LLVEFKVGRALALKESLRKLWDQATASRVRYWKCWFWWVTYSHLELVREVVYPIKRHWTNAGPFFHHRIPNADSNPDDQKILQASKCLTISG